MKWSKGMTVVKAMEQVSTAPDPFQSLLGCMFSVDTPQKVNTLALDPSTGISSSTNCSGAAMSSNPQSYTSLEYNESKVYEDFF